MFKRQQPKGWGWLFPCFGLFSLVLGAVILRGFYIPEAVTFTEGEITSAEWVGLKHPRFVVRLRGHAQDFQIGAPADLRTIAETVRAGRSARIGQTDDRAALLNDNTRVYSLAVDGETVFTLDEYRATVRSERPGLSAIFVAAVALTLVGFISRRRQMRRVKPMAAADSDKSNGAQPAT